ncbi:hypothetical protein [Bradyrhizobium sp. S3.3.6]|uniref:DUF7380 domain-containing protein n=1 Tax=Bradyrhizobium sp. S3.3.6 TaxID=3156429 RepID=UPI00339B44CF
MNTTEDAEEKIVADDSAAVSEPQGSPVWLRASLTDLFGLDIEAPIVGSQSADSDELGQQFRAAIYSAVPTDPETPAARVFSMLTAVMGMHLKAKEPNEPFGPMVAWADGRRSAAPVDFRGEPLDVLAEIATHAKHPVLRARLADICWLLDRKRVQLGTAAISAYVEIVKKVAAGALRFRFDSEKGALKHEARDLLRRALSIARGRGIDPSAGAAARDLVADLRKRSLEQRSPIPVLWFSHLDLDFGVSEPAEIGSSVESLIPGLASDTDGHTIVNLRRLASRAFHLGKKDSDQRRSQAEAAEQLARMAEQQPLAMLAASLLSEAIAELHGVPGKKERRKELRHRLVDVQSGIADEMSPFTIPINLEEIVNLVQQEIQQRLSLRDKLFVFAALERSPDPAKLTDTAAKSIREHPLASLFAATHHDGEGKVIHRSEGAGFGDAENASAIERQIAEDERVRRHVVAAGKIETARLAIAAEHYLLDDVFVSLLLYSAFVPRDAVATYSRGFLRFFQGDFVSGLYILTPLIENSLRHVLKSHGHDVTNFDDATMTQQDRTISVLFEQMRPELYSIFGRSITTDIENVFLKKSGPHLRHSLAHGLLPDGAAYGADAIYGCWLAFHLCMLPLFPVRTQLTIPYDLPQDDANAPTPEAT